MTAATSCPHCHGSGGDLYFDVDRRAYRAEVLTHTSSAELLKAKALSLRLVHDILPAGPERMVAALNRELCETGISEHEKRRALADKRAHACCRDACSHINE